MHKTTTMTPLLLLAMLTGPHLLAAPDTGTASPQNAAPQAVTLPMAVEANRVFIQMDLVRPAGTRRKARFIIDTGGGAFMITEKLATEAGIPRIGEEIVEEGERFVRIGPADIRAGSIHLDLSSANTLAVRGRQRVMDMDAEGFLPASVLRHYHVVFDYPAHQFTLAQPGALTPRGVKVDSPIGPRSGFPRIELAVDGATYGFLLDTGAPFTMASRVVMDQWTKAHPEWPRLTGAAGFANMIGNRMETEALVLRLPELAWASFRIPPVGVVSRPEGTYERYMSSMMTAPIAGAIAGNVLRNFRVEIDYPNGATYLEMPGTPVPDELDAVGVTVRLAPDGVFVAGVAKKDGKPVVEGLEPGDKLLQAGEAKLAGATLAQVLVALHGAPGETKRLFIERAGKQMTVEARVSRLL